MMFVASVREKNDWPRIGSVVLMNINDNSLTRCSRVVPCMVDSSLDTG